MTGLSSELEEFHMSEPSANCTHDCSSCGENCSSRTADRTSFLEPLNPASSVKKVIGIVSGKGGVGKSLVTSLLAVKNSLYERIPHLGEKGKPFG